MTRPLRVERIYKSYGSTSVLRDVSAEFLSGRVTALVGPNGAGKTTLLRIIAGLQTATSGNVDGPEALYYGGIDTLPVRGTVNGLRRAFDLPELVGGRRKLNTLSRGQLHSVGLDIAFAIDAPILLLDEPWSSLEPDARFRLNAGLTAYAASGRIVVCSSHELDEVGRVADDVAFLRNGGLTMQRGEALGGERFDHALLLATYRKGA